MSRALRASAIPFRLVMPAACNSAMTGARSAAIRLARADRAMSAAFGARWPMWRPVGIGAVCHRRVNSSATLSPRDADLVRVKVNRASASGLAPQDVVQAIHDDDLADLNRLSPAD